MASKYLFLPLLLVIISLHCSTLSASSPHSLPVIHIISALKSPFYFEVATYQGVEGDGNLRPGQDYRIKVDTNQLFAASAYYGLKIASFDAYEPVRDKGRAAIYWKADDYGFSLSYDNVNYKQVAPWDKE